MSEHSNEPAWQPFGRPRRGETPPPEKLAADLRAAADAVAEALADDRPADALAYAGTAVEAAGALRDALTERDRPPTPTERLRRSLFQKETAR